MANNLTFEESNFKTWKILSPIGRIDTVTASQAEKTATETLNSNQSLAFDLSRLEYLSSAGLRVLFRMAKLAKKSKKTFVFFGASGMIKEVLEASGMDLLFTMYGSKDDLP